jgi:hypothetical protein
MLPALIGLIAGIAHGVVSHQAGLPLGLVEQMYQLVERDPISLQ